MNLSEQHVFIRGPPGPSHARYIFACIYSPDTFVRKDTQVRIRGQSLLASLEKLGLKALQTDPAAMRLRCWPQDLDLPDMRTDTSPQQADAKPGSSLQYQCV